jgi:hypothetical protein
MKIIIFLLLLYISIVIAYLKIPKRYQRHDRYNSATDVSSYAETWISTLDVIKNNLFLEPTTEQLDKLCSRISVLPSSSREYTILSLSRRNLLIQMLQQNRTRYLEMAKEYSDKIDRNEFPNLQDVPIRLSDLKFSQKPDTDLVNDCILQNITFSESLLDKFLLSVFRKYVQEEIKYVSLSPGIRGLLEEGRYYMLSEEGTPYNQHKFVRTVLGRLLTPFMPPFYRLFMAGYVPSMEKGDPKWLVSSVDYLRSKLPDFFQKEIPAGKQLGPWFYAPVLTSFVTPLFLNFLVGPSRMNRRKDGQLGGIMVEKCKFLQESGCKGIFL